VGLDFTPGIIDEVRIFDRALSDDEILRLYAAGAAGMCRPLTRPTIVTSPSSYCVLTGANLSLSVLAAGSEPLSYQWRLNGSAIMDATNISLALTNVILSQSGIYDAIVFNSLGSATSLVAQLTVKLPPTTLAEDFECLSPDGLPPGWSADNGIWQAGTPSSGPSTAHSGHNV